MIISYLRTKLRKKTLFARQSWAPKDNSYISNKFNELKLEYRCYGNKNPNKFFYIIRRSPGAGFFSNLNFVIHNLLICDQLKMIPVVDMENYQTYYNCKIKIKNSYNSWNYYFEPVSKYSLKDVYQSKNVVICDSRTSSEGYNKERYIYNFKFFNGFQFLDSRHKKIMKKYIKIKKDIVKDAEKIYKQFNKKKVIGICFRGSDSKKNAYQPHVPTYEQMEYATNILLKKHRFHKIFLCTEDSDYLKFYKKKYGSKVIYNNSPRTTDSVDLFDYPERKHRYKVGRGNLVDMLVLGKTNYMLFGVSNIPYTAIFFSKQKKIPHSIIDNGMKGGIFISQVSFFIRKLLPSFLGGFEKKMITKDRLIKLKKSDFEII